MIALQLGLCSGRCQIWWDYLQAKGLEFEYCLKPAKIILIIRQWLVERNRCKNFKNTRIKITDQVEHYLGAVIGTESFREQYIKNKVEGWVKDLQLL